jgi:hypothetical protein
LRAVALVALLGFWLAAKMVDVLGWNSVASKAALMA